MKKSEVYKAAIAAVIGFESLDMEDRIEVLRVLFEGEFVAKRVENTTRSEIDKAAEELVGMPPEPVKVR